ncbi:uncharacterized protein LOC110450727 [Mizuhopecten yessoensis]|uniref:CUB domain-containing protein n=1 Tax=Mizuhopecten yessoensis TaxID=6573 RepID=A0A210QND1_MIZYE|nr:uncharacterized protein LOC110450727 [Mizuhopecten yessoensis]OWF50232.1 hypothetical protein KP79_PYT06761 [Mizuhopecten yessoensis]
MAVYRDRYLLFILHLVFTAVYGDQGTSNGRHEIHGCYAKLFFPTCTDGTKMAIFDLKYGVKTPSDVCPSQTTTTVDQHVSCCSYKPGDCLVPMMEYTDIHRYYAAFSAQTVPLYQPQLGWRRIVANDNCTVERTFSNFVSMDYRCIADAATIDMTTVNTLSGQFISAMYPLIGGEDAREDNLCTVTSGQPGLVIYALDIRLECYIGYENGTCIGNHSLTFMDGKHNKTFVSKEDTVLGQYQVIFSTIESSMMFIFQRDNGSRPQMVWFGVRGKENTTTVTVSCNELEVTAPGVSTRQSTRRPSPAGNNTQTANNETDHIMAIVVGVSSGSVFVFFVIVVFVCRWRRNRSDKLKADALNDYRRRIKHQNNEMQPRQVPGGHQAKPKQQQQGRVKTEQKESNQGATDHQRSRKLNLNSPKGLELSMNDPVYHDITIPSRAPRPETADNNKHKRHQ